MKTLSIGISCFISSFLLSQQKEEFRLVKNYYNQHRNMLNKEFKKKFDAESNSVKKIEIKGDFLFFMKKMDSIENNAMIGALLKVRNLEDLQTIKNPRLTSSKKFQDAEKIADYPGGLNSLRQEVANLLYIDGVYSEEKMVKTDVAFIVEKDGTVSNVHAQGDNFTFNRQAEIALYSLAEKFSPAMIKGDPITYCFKLPLTLTMTD
ncbi:energy transducer TonB [Chryseobacterium sp. 'Rf worker isolate 10']|uniref:energy transducer TonB n=1 Tax=Chryseobacterium sp. 'Rf worker isolate 10' TaxID=2887348 RepID=UPI003D6EA47B